MRVRVVGGLDELLGESCERIVLVEIFVGAVDHGLGGHLDVVGVVSIDEVKDEVVSPGHDVVLEDRLSLGRLEVVVRIGLLESEAKPGLPGLETDASLGATIGAIELWKIVAEDVDLVLGEVVDELAVEGPALDLT